MERDIAKIVTELWENWRTDALVLGRRLLIALVIVIAGKVITSLVKKMINRAVRGRLQLDATLASMLKMVVNYATVIVCLIMILDVFGINTASLIAMLGAAGVAVGLALKDTLSNIAAGIVLILQGACRKGDFVEFGGISGTVREINLFTTILETVDGVYVSAPNSAVWGSPLKNYTRNGRRRMDLPVSIAYEDSIDRAFEVLQAVIAAEPRFLPDPAPQIMVQSLGDSSVNLLLRAWAEGDVYWQLFWDQTRNLKERIEGAGLHIPFPQMDVSLKR